MSNINKEISKMKYLFEYEQGKVISEQTAFERNLDKQFSTVKGAEDYAESMSGLLSKLSSLISPTKILDKLTPLHLRALYRFIFGKTDPMDETILTGEEQKYLWDVATKFGIKKGFTYPLWKELGASNLPTAVSKEGISKETQKLKTAPQEGSLLSPNFAGQFMYTLGEILPAGIKKIDNDTIEIIDNYDFNTSSLNADEVIQQLSDTISQFKEGDASAYSVIRKLVALRELTGYEGYPIKFRIKNPYKTDVKSSTTKTDTQKIQERLKDKEFVKKLQNKLKTVDNGKYSKLVGAADGIYGVKTKNALSRFINDKGFKVTSGDPLLGQIRYLSSYKS